MALSNNAQRVIVSLITIPLILAACYFGGWFFFFFVLAIALVSYVELYLLAKNKGMNANLTIGLLAIIYLLYSRFNYIFDLYSFLIVLMLFVSFVELFRKEGSAIYNIGATLLGIFYIGLFSSAFLGIREIYPRIGDIYQQGGYLIISIFASIWICDSAAYYIGTAFGKHKLFPRVSPKKSWEGAAAGFVFAILTFIAAHFIILQFISLTDAVVMGIIVGIFGQVGDLVESLIKRDAGVKDSSNIIPGHGGIFDRFDSILFTAPMIFLYLNYVSR